jgi:hypothetical protein
METATDGMSGGGMAPESEESKSLKKLRCSMKGLKRMKKDSGEDTTDAENTLRRLEEESEAGIIPANFLESVAPFFFMFCAMIVFYCFVFALKGCVMKEKLGKLAQTLRYNAITRFFLIFYLPIMIFSLMTIRDDNEGMENATAGEILAYICFFGLLFFKGYVFFIILKKSDEMSNNPDFAVHHNTLTYELKPDRTSQFYYPIYLIHKFLLSVFLVSIAASALGRITMIIVVQLAMLVFTIYSKPFVSKIQQIVMTINEALLFVAGLCLYGVQTLSGDAQDNAGYAFVAIFALFLAVNVARMVFEIIQSCKG